MLAYDDLRNARWDRTVSTRTSTEESWISLPDWHKAENSRQTLAAQIDHCGWLNCRSPRVSHLTNRQIEMRFP